MDLIIPIFRKGEYAHNYLEIITSEEFATLFGDDLGDDEMDVSMLQIHMLSTSGMCRLETVYRTMSNELIRIRTNSGLQFHLAPEQEVAVIDGEIQYIKAKNLRLDDVLVGFSGEFNNIFADREFLDIITELLRTSPVDKLSNITVRGIKEYMRSVNLQDEKIKNSMDITAFSALVAENGVYDDELDFLQLSSKENDIHVSSKLFISPELFEFLGVFWRHGHYERGIPVCDVASLPRAKEVVKLIKKALNAGSTIIPMGKMFRVSLHTSIYTRILSDIFGMLGLPSSSKLPDRIFNADEEHVMAFLSAVLQDDEIICHDHYATQEFLLLLRTLSIYPVVEDERIVFTENDLKMLEDEEAEEQDPAEIIRELDTVLLDQAIPVYQLKCAENYYAGQGILLRSKEE
ncbi:MAG: hypothetical protein INQ03_06835 [Candidatus Heimdallarchaeota archaeon]|nr:hypothetical protein [Candidatus Heimdallarchaeota archaeon]